MLPLVALSVCDTGANPSDARPPIDMNELARRASAAAERRASMPNNGQLERLPPQRKESELNTAILEMVQKREDRVRETRDLQIAKDEEAARAREARADAMAVQIELNKANDALSGRSDTEEMSDTDESDVHSMGVNEDDEGAIDDLDRFFDDAEEMDSLDVAAIDSIYEHLEQALAEINTSMAGMASNDENVLLFGVATRLKADMRLLLSIRKAILGANGTIVQAPSFRRDVRRVEDVVQEIVDMSKFETPSATARRWNDLVLPLVGMLAFILSTYAAMSSRSSGDSNGDNVPLLNPFVLQNSQFGRSMANKTFVTVPVLSPTQHKKFRSRFHAAVRSAAKK